MVRGGVDDAHDCACLLHVRANGGEGGGEVVEGHAGEGVHVADREGDKLHSSQIFPKGPDVKGLFLVFYAILLSQPKSLYKSISTDMRVH